MVQERTRTQYLLCVLLGVVLLGMVSPAGADLRKPAPAPDAEDGKLRIICFGAHPDDNEFRAGGVATLWAAQGHHVKFVSVTNGDIGHWGMAGGPLAQVRAAEVERCAEIFGIERHLFFTVVVELCGGWRCLGRL